MPTSSSAGPNEDAVKRANSFADTLNRVMLSLIASALFCILTVLGAADRSLVASSASIKVPFTEAQVSFEGFMVVAPVLLTAIAVYLHLLYEHWLRATEDSPAAQYPALFGLGGNVADALTTIVFYWLTPLTLAALTWKASARQEWGVALALLTVCLLGGSVRMIFFRKSNGERWIHAIALALTGFLALVVPATLNTVAHYRVFGSIGSWARPLDLSGAEFKPTEWLVAARFQRANFQRAILEGVSLNSADLRGADFRGANLQRARFYHAKFDKADFRRADLRGADLRLAVLRDANLKWARLPGADFTSADLVGADLGAADLRGADFSEATGMDCDRLRGAQIDATTRLPSNVAHCWP